MSTTIDRHHRRQHKEPGPERIDTAHLRQPPDCIIIGAQKGGTSSCYRYLKEHPDVAASLKKEVHFFSLRFDRGMDWYLAHFPEPGNGLVCEASPSYLFHPEAPARVQAALPGVKLIALLRNPVDRAYSHYQMNVRKGDEPLPFEEAIAQEPERLRQSGGPSTDEWRLFSYLDRGVYVDQLRRWLSLFPREQLLVIKSEDFFAEPQRIYNQTLEFLGLRPWQLPVFKIYKSGDYHDMRPETRARLRDHFAPHNRQLYELLGRDLGWDDE